MKSRRRPNRLEMGNKPAARILRTSGVQATVTGDEDRGEQSPTPPPVVLGSVVERRTKAKSKSKKLNGKSKFAAEATRSGFPSVSVPLGTLVAENRTNVHQTNLLSAAEGKTLTRQGQEITRGEDVPCSQQASNMERLKLDSSKEAEQILKGMSAGEIQESLREINASLDPKTLEFLKSRKQQLRSRTSTPRRTMEKSNKLATLDETKLATNTTEKQQIASIMSSITSYEDLDAAFDAYQQEHEQQQSDGITVKSPLESTVQGSNDFELACQLLRSSSPQQTIWASRTIAKYLLQTLADSRTSSCLRPKEDPPVVPYPMLLPVSLRCLLDVSHSSQTGPGILQTTYALESLAALVRLRVCPDHVVDVTCTDERSIFQLDFMCDAVPGPAISTCYQSSITSSDDSPHQDIASVYYTGSSTAKADAQAFWNDPLWTLLSKMRILPRCAQLLQQHQQLPVEATRAISNILAMVAQRSAGAATAIVQHATLLKGLWRHHRGHSWVVSCTLLRQSRYTAEQMADALYVEIVQELTHGSTTHSQRWALIAWRILFRYGVLTDENDKIQTMLTLAVPNLAVVGSDLAADWYATMAAAASTRREDEWLHSAALFRQVISCLTNPSRVSESLNHYWRRMASVLQYFLSFFISEKTNLFLGDESSKALRLVADSKQLHQAFAITLPFLPTLDLSQMPFISHTALQEEASACAMVISFLNIVRRSGTSELRTHVAAILGDMLNAGGLHESGEKEASTTTSTASRRNWINRMTGTVILFLLENEGGDVPLYREFSFAMIGRLELGDEAVLSKFLKFGHLFGDAPEILRVLERQLQKSSSQVYVQLKHSFTLCEDKGATEEGSCPPRSFVSEAETPGPRRDADEFLLPVGKYWLWQFLAGEVGSVETDGGLNEESQEVMLSSLKLVSKLEQDSSFYASGLCAGPKLYFLSTLCLLGSAFFSSKDLVTLANHLFDTYLPLFSDYGQQRFTAMCHKHMSSKDVDRSTSKPKIEDGQMKALLHTVLPAASERSMDSLVNDVIRIHEDSGVDSAVCTKVLRLFLCNRLSTKSKCHVVNHFGRSMHLLSIPGEDKNERGVWFRCMIGGGLPAIDGSLRDSPQLLDCLAKAYCQHMTVRGDDKFLLSWACLLFTRSLAIAINSQSGMDAAKTRVWGLSPKVLGMVLDMLALFMNSDGSLDSLIQSTMTETAERGCVDSATLKARLDNVARYP